MQDTRRWKRRDHETTDGKGGRQITNLGNTIREQRERERDRENTQREKEKEGKGWCSLARLTKRLFPHPALIPKLNHSAGNQACSRFMQINDTLHSALMYRDISLPWVCARAGENAAEARG